MCLMLGMMMMVVRTRTTELNTSSMFTMCQELLATLKITDSSKTNKKEKPTIELVLLLSTVSE